jgi:hypothetical protein
MQNTRSGYSAYFESSQPSILCIIIFISTFVCHVCATVTVTVTVTVAHT